jgi:hypothetical protein
MISELVFHSPSGACEGHQRNSFVTPCECIRRHATFPLADGAPRTPSQSTSSVSPPFHTKWGQFVKPLLYGTLFTLCSNIPDGGVYVWHIWLRVCISLLYATRMSVRQTFRITYGRFATTFLMPRISPCLLLIPDCTLCVTIRPSPFLRNRRFFQDFFIRR